MLENCMSAPPAMLTSQVRSGDPKNLEARAARIYWKALFEGEEFRRDFEAEGVNACLNYGYAVLRAIVARALCGAGLHPGLGLHHLLRPVKRKAAECISEAVPGKP